MTQDQRGLSRAAASAVGFGSSMLGAHPIRDAGLLFGVLLCALMAQISRPAAAHGREAAPTEFNAAACYQLVQSAARHIAWARWEKGFQIEKTRSTVLRAGAPTWANDLKEEWISDAYRWRASDQQILQWAAELGSVEDLPSAEELSVHETIAIWMRRIGRQCAERAEHPDASANFVRFEPRLEP